MFPSHLTHSKDFHVWFRKKRSRNGIGDKMLMIFCLTPVRNAVETGVAKWRDVGWLSP